MDLTATLLAVCGGGGSDAVAFAALALGVVLWLLAIRIPLAQAEDGTEALHLVALLAGSVLIGGFVFLYPGGVSGDQDFLLRFFLSLMLSGAVAVAVAGVTRRVSMGRALFVALAGDVFVPGGLIALLFTSLVLGTGCLS